MTGGYTMKEKNIRELAKRMGLITVEDMCQYTIAQLVVKIANKVNELVDEVWRFETDVQETLKTQNENIQYLLGEGLHLEVENIFDGWLQDGTFDSLLNQSALKKVNDRIDETNAQLSKITYFLTPEMFGAIGDGVADDTNAFKLMAQNSANKTAIIEMTGEYLLSDKVEFDSNTTLNFNNSKIIWNNTDNIIDEKSHDGIFTFKGSRTNVSTQLTGYTQMFVPNNCGRWDVVDVSGFNVGDFIEIECLNGFPKPTSFDEALPYVNMMAKIIHIDNNSIYTDYYTPFDLSGLNWGSETLIHKINPVTNVEVNDLNIENIVPWENRVNGSGTGANLEKLASGVFFKYCYNVTVNNVMSNRIQNPSVFLFYCNKYNISNIECNAPSHTGSGQGYAVKIVASSFGEISNVTGYKCRHIIDFSRGSCFCEVSNCKGNWSNNDSFSYCFDLHGNYEHNIVFNNCDGALLSGNGLGNFPQMSGYITLINCKINSSLGNVYKLKAENCDIIAKNYDNTSNRQIDIELIDCILRIGRNFSFDGTTRGGTFKTSFKIIGGKVLNWLPEQTSSIINNIDGFEYVEFDNVEIDYSKADRRLYIRNAKELYIDNCVIKGTVFELSRNDTNVARVHYSFSENHYIVSDSDTLTLSSMTFLRFTNVKNSNGIINFKDNTIDIDSQTPAKYVVLNTTDDLTNSNLLLNFKNNTIITNNNNSCIVNCSSVGNGLKVNIDGTTVTGNINNIDRLIALGNNTWVNGIRS